MSQAIKHIKNYTSHGPDRILMQSLKIKNLDKILSLIFTYSHSNNVTPACLQKVRTIILLDKGENVNDVTNWRPITICSVVRRVYEKILDKRVKEHNILYITQQYTERLH